MSDGSVYSRYDQSLDKMKWLHSLWLRGGRDFVEFKLMVRPFKIGDIGAQLTPGCLLLAVSAANIPAYLTTTPVSCLVMSYWTRVKMVVELPYSLHDRYASIAIAWTVIIIPPVFINLGLFYGLWYGKPNMDRILVLTIPTAVLGIFTVIAIIERMWKLTRLSPKFRPLNSPRNALDIFQWGYFAALILISGLITSTLSRGDIDHDVHEFQIRLLSMPASVLMYFLATLTLLSLFLNFLKVKLPFRFGSFDSGNVLRPAVYYVIEDVVAVDGNGGIEYREAFAARYDNSPVFQKMIWRLSVVWMVAFYVFAALFTVLVFRLPKAAVYAVGWAGPFPLAGLLAIWTIFYVKSQLKKEREVQAEHSIDSTGPVRRSLEGERTPLLGNTH